MANHFKMKSHRILTGLTLFFIVCSCKKEETRVEKPYEDLLTSGSWTISNFVFPLAAVNYDGYSLIFNEDGKMQATDNISVSGGGVWKIWPEFIVDMQMEGDDFEYLNGSWNVVSHNASKLELQTGIVGQFTMTLTKN